MPIISRLVVAVALQLQAASVLGQQCGPGDCADPANGPNGLGCGPGHCNDGAPGDNAFTCDCPGWRDDTGDNCNACPSDTWKTVVCNNDGTGTTYQQWSDSDCTTPKGAAVTDALFLHDPHGGVALGQCHHLAAGRTVSYKQTCTGDAGSMTAIQSMWPGPACGDEASALMHRAAGGCECVQPKDVRAWDSNIVQIYLVSIAHQSATKRCIALRASYRFICLRLPATALAPTSLLQLIL
jgi:hypothetical protein